MDYVDPISIGIPEPSTPLFNGVNWGCPSQLFTPAYWKAQYHLEKTSSRTINYKLGENLIQEVVACILGGFGIPSEHGVAMFQRLKHRALIIPKTTQESLLNSLSEALQINQRKVKYRFPNQKAKYIHAFLNRDDLDNIPTHNDLELRKWLLGISGIGPKTASWITRNYLDSERVAILDVHIIRAGVLAGIFNSDHDLNRDYLKLERKFITFCQRLDVKPSYMDALMWLQMKNSNRLALKATKVN